MDPDSRPVVRGSFHFPHLVSVTRGIQDSLGLGVPDERVVVSRYEPQAYDLNTRWIERWRAS